MGSFARGGAERAVEATGVGSWAVMVPGGPWRYLDSIWGVTGGALGQRSDPAISPVKDLVRGTRGHQGVLEAGRRLPTHGAAGPAAHQPVVPCLPDAAVLNIKSHQHVKMLQTLPSPTSSAHLVALGPWLDLM